MREDALPHKESASEIIPPPQSLIAIILVAMLLLHLRLHWIPKPSDDNQDNWSNPLGPVQSIRYQIQIIQADWALAGHQYTSLVRSRPLGPRPAPNSQQDQPSHSWPKHWQARRRSPLGRVFIHLGTKATYINDIPTLVFHPENTESIVKDPTLRVTSSLPSNASIHGIVTSCTNSFAYDQTNLKFDFAAQIQQEMENWFLSSWKN